MNYFEPITRVFGNLRGFYSGINGATLTGAIDVIVVEQADGTYKCSPFHVRFGKLGVLRSKEKVVDLEVNGLPVSIRMKLGDSGEAFFVEEIESDEDYDFDSNLATSPIPTSSFPTSVELEKLNDEINKLNTSTSGDPVGPGPPLATAPTTLTKKRRRKRKKNTNSSNVNGSNSKTDLQIQQQSQEPDESGPSHGSPPEGGIFQMDEDYHQLDGENLTPGSVGVVPTTETTGTTSDPEDEEIQIQVVPTTCPNLPHSRSFHRDFYSDTEVDLDGNPSPHNSRPSTPIQSDSEYEINKTQTGEASVLLSEDSAKWPWGEFPNSNPSSPGGNGSTNATGAVECPELQIANKSGTTSSDEEGGRISFKSPPPATTGTGGSKRSMLSGMFSFMKPRSLAAQQETDGRYLDDLNVESMDPEEFAMYFPNTKFLGGTGGGSSRGGGSSTGGNGSKSDNDDVESGKGNSLPQSPQPGSSPTKPPEFITAMETQTRSHHPAFHQLPNFEAISLCGDNLALFEQSEVTYDELVENPDLILRAHPESIVFKVDGKYVPWSAALPQLLSTMFFRRPLPGSIVQKLSEQYSTRTSQPPVVANSSPTTSPQNSKPSSPTSSPKKSSPNSSPTQSATGTEESQAKDSPQDPSNRRPGFWSSFPWRRSYSTSNSTNPVQVQQHQQSQLQQLQEQSQSQQSENNNNKASGTSSSDESEGGGGLEDPNNKSGRSSRISAQHTVIKIPGAEKYRKTLRLSSEEIKRLGLRPGQNEAVFSVTTAYQGTSVARCHIYLWKHDDRIVVSDIDGTITKSDVLGHILPIIGNDWAQSGVAQLFTQIQANGYKMLYLSARAIGQASITREYLRSIRQGDVTLPDGPLLLNPTSLMSAFHREVIEKKPEEFKIACLRDVQLLFPTNPFYAGYGNRINDVWAYRAVDIAISRIFTINHRGELRHALTNTFQSSYTSLVELAEHIFPPYKDGCQGEGNQGVDGFSTFEFWREPFPSLGAILSQQIVEREALAAAAEAEGNNLLFLSHTSRRYSNP